MIYAPEFEETLLQASRNGDLYLVEEILQGRSENRLTVNVNCKGRSKSNSGWAPLHLASYFGHHAVSETLLKNNADVNIQNDFGDTPLHKASFTGRESIVILLLQYNADVTIINGEGYTPKDLALGKEIRKLLEGAEKTEIRKKEEKLLNASREGDTDTITSLLKGTSPPNVNCIDSFGNTALHCAAYRCRKEVAVLLLQNGIDPSVYNKRGQRAVDLAQSGQMKEILEVQPIRPLQRHVAHFEGPIMKRSRFLGWKNVWAVLERGVLTYFSCRADACGGVHRKGFKQLDGAKVIPVDADEPLLLIHFSDNTTHRLCLPSSGDGNLNMQKWANAFQEHVAYSSHYMSQGISYVDSDEDEASEVLKLGSLQDVLQTAQAYQQLLERQLNTIETRVASELQETKDVCFIVDVADSRLQRLKEVVDTSRAMVASLGQCLAIFMQQEDVRLLQLKQEQEKCRVLEQALHALAKEHHELEKSLSSTPYHSPKSFHSVRSPRFYDTSDDEFYDANEGDDCDGKVMTRNGSRSSTLFSTAPYLSSSNSTLTSWTSSRRNIENLSDRLVKIMANDDPSGQIPEGQKEVQWRHRTTLPVPMFSRNDFSIWSILKHCIGKELSKITMPVIFNEPLSFLQRFTEYMEYSYLLNQASACEDPIARMEYVAAFAVSSLASNWERLGKPFNPLLGETFELERDNFRLVSEQVSHHPPISAFHAEAPHFKFYGTVSPKIKFWGKSVEIQPKGVVTLELLHHNEAYTWTNINCCVHNIIVGKLWIEQYGVMELVNHRTGNKCVLNFKPAGWFSKDLHRFDGFIQDKQKNKLRYMYGKWTDLLKSVDVPSYEDYVRENAERFKKQGPPVDKSPRNTPTASPAHTPKKGLYKFNSLSAVLPFGSGGSGNNSSDDGSESANGLENMDADDPPKNNSTFSIDIPNSVLLWEPTARPENSHLYYQYTLFAMSLNELTDELKSKLPATDSRLRPDVRKLEEGDIDGAAAEKNRLEEKQREARKSRRKDKDNWQPRWFKLSFNPHSKEEEWLYEGGYWDRNFDRLPDIF